MTQPPHRSTDPTMFTTSRQPRKSETEVTQSCLTLCDPTSMDCSLPGFSVHRIFQARILEWVAISFSRGSSRPSYQTQVSCIVGRRFSLSDQGRRRQVFQGKASWWAVWELRGLEARGAADQNPGPLGEEHRLSSHILLGSSRQHFLLPQSTGLKQRTTCSAKLLLSLLVIDSSAEVPKHLMQSPIIACITCIINAQFHVLPYLDCYLRQCSRLLSKRMTLPLSSSQSSPKMSVNNVITT